MSKLATPGDEILLLTDRQEPNVRSLVEGKPEPLLVRVYNRFFLLGDSEPKVFFVLCLSALLLITARLLTPIEIDKDQGVQLEAAYRLAGGQGLTSTDTFKAASLDVSEPAEMNYVTWWPPGYSILIAGTLLLGLPIQVSLKVICGLTTLMGWFGWGGIASQVMSKPLRIRRWRLPVNFIIAALAPIIVTPSWQGTDIFLWAGIPWIVLLLIRARHQQGALTLTLIAGLLFGCLLAIRYASFFILVGTPLILLQLYWPDYKSVMKQLVAFTFASLLIIVPTVAYIKNASAQNVTSERWVRNDSLVQMSNTTMSEIKGMAKGTVILTHLVFGVPETTTLIRRLWPETDKVAYTMSTIPRLIIGLGCLVVILSLPLIVRRKRLVATTSFPDFVLPALSSLPLSLTVFLMAAMLLTHTPLFGVDRYYEPLQLTCILIFYALATWGGYNKAVKASAMTIIAFFALYLLTYLPAYGVLLRKPEFLVREILSFNLSNSQLYPSTSEKITYPSFQLYSRKEATRIKVKELSKTNPEAVFFINEASLFTFDGFPMRDGLTSANFRDFPPFRYFQNAYTGRDIKIFWVCDPQMVGFIPASNLNVVYDNPTERSIILESQFPAGYKFLQHK
jgi:hypothetical protein